MRTESAIVILSPKVTSHIITSYDVKKQEVTLGQQNILQNWQNWGNGRIGGRIGQNWQNWGQTRFNQVKSNLTPISFSNFFLAKPQPSLTPISFNFLLAMINPLLQFDLSLFASGSLFIGNTHITLDKAEIWWHWEGDILKSDIPEHNEYYIERFK
ncbi:MAG: hypothetical protein WAQ56_07885 [Candidatus Nitrotoga sp.]